MLDGSEHARMVPMLPCRDIDGIAAFWTALASGPDLTASDREAIERAVREIGEL